MLRRVFLWRRLSSRAYVGSLVRRNPAARPRSSAPHLRDIPLEKMALSRETPFSFSVPLDRVAWLPAEDDRHMRPDDTVLGLVVGNHAWAVPWWIMKNHHLANLVLADRPIMLVLCEACAAAAAFLATLDGRRHTFRVEGKYAANHILMDLETESLWAPTGGEALHGPLAGARLERLPLYQCTWQEWKALRPDTRVPDGKGESRDGHGSDFPTPDARILPGFVERTRLVWDRRLDDLELVLGVEVDGHARAYPLARLHQLGPVLNDTIGGREVLIFTKPRSWLSIAFDRRVDGRGLVFRAAGDGASLEDVETGSRWDITGRAIAGPLVGRSLRFVPSGIEKWYAWSSSHRATEVYEPPG